jgi:signal transduction histidine kinase
MKLSLAWRIRLLVAVGPVLAVTVVSIAAYASLRAVYLGQLDRILETMARGIAAVASAGVGPETLHARIEEITASPWRGPRSEFRLWLEGASADLASSSPTTRGSGEWDLAGRVAPPLGEPRFFDVAYKQKRLRAAWLRREIRGEVANVLILHSANYEQRRLRELLAVLAAAGGGTALLAMLLAGPVVRRTLEPLRTLARRTAAIVPGVSPAVGPSDAGLPPELRPLAAEIEALAGRFSAAVARERALVPEAAHQLRTPLAIVRSTLDLASAAPEDAAGCREAVREAVQDVRRMQRLVEQLVLLAGVESSAQPAVRMRLDALLEELAERHRGPAEERGIRLACERLAAAEVEGDEGQLRLLFGALIENAIHHGPAGGTVRIGLEIGPAGHCTVTVQDDGGSVSPADLDRLFERFFRAGATRGRHPAGAGLGLTIAREIGRRHGGDVWVTSTPGTRTTSHVRLPACRNA